MKLRLLTLALAALALVAFVSAEQTVLLTDLDLDNSLELADGVAGGHREDRDDGEPAPAAESPGEGSPPAAAAEAAPEKHPAPLLPEKVPSGSIGVDILPPQQVLGTEDGILDRNLTGNPADQEYLPGGPSTFTVTSSEVS